MNKLFSILIFAVFFSFFANGQEKKKYVYEDSTLIEEEVVVADTTTSVIEVAPTEETYTTKKYEEQKSYIDTTLYYRNLTNNVDSVAAIKNAKAFGYVNYLDSLLKEEQEKQKKNKPKDKPNVNLSWLDAFFSSGILHVLLWTLAIGFVLFILYKLFLTDGIFRRNASKSDSINAVVEEEKITAESDFDALIQNAEQVQNYRLAVRYHYLKSLYLLAQKNIVQLAVDKTNFNYVQEIRDEQKRNTFSSLTLNYEYVWYGEFDVDNVIYYKINSAFKNFNSII
jgi:hypothetical protein